MFSERKECFIMHIEEKLDLILKEQETIREMIELFLPNLESEKGVIHFLEVTKNTFNNYISKGILVEGKHFIKKAKRKVFIPDAVIELKKSGIKGKRHASSKQDTLDAVNLQLGIIPMCRSAV